MRSLFYEAQVTVHGVDGETIHHIQTSSIREIKWFLQRYDHEGSDVCAVIRHTPERWERLEFGEEVYQWLSSL